ncbi:MAG: carboxypeptidase-like regulatory domain-containing protein [Candidatus Hodarchaeales archaeon]
MIKIEKVKTEELSSNKKQTCIMTILILILLLSLSNIIQMKIDYSNELLVEKTSIPKLGDNSINDYQSLPIHPPSLTIHSSQKPSILFIVTDPTSLDPILDKPFVDFINLTLKFNVTCHDDNNSYSYEGYDAIIISDSINVDQVSSLNNASIPILIMESFTFSVFRIASGRGSANGDSLFILNSSHYITSKETSETSVIVYNSSAEIKFLKGYNVPPPEIDSLAQRLLAKVNERTLIALDKGRKDWDNYLAAERRVFWGATQGNILNQKGWELWNRTLRWILYDDINGSATINVNVNDLDNRDVPNAEVNLTHSYNTNQNFSQNTTVDGQTTFTNIPYGTYNITIEFEDSVNDTFSLINITGEQTFNLTANFDFTVRINEYVDNDPPIISNIGFFTTNKTFHADIFDVSSLMMVNLSLTANNGTFSIEKNYTMVTTDGIFYYNYTAAQDLSSVNVTYNITAIDVAGNVRVSETYRFLLGDITPPTIYEYNVTDYENGTLQFYANITDAQSDVQDPVVLKINGSFVDMHLNASGYWVYRVQAYYGITLNYTIWSANDSVGNEIDTRESPITPKFGLVTPKDVKMPHIWGVSDDIAVHENGYVQFTSYVEDWDEFQSGINISTVQLTLSVNGVNTSYIMTPIGAITYYYEFTFNFEDTVNYWINASDLAGNINPGDIHGPFTIDDNAIPIVSYWAEEWGNGTVDFHTEIIDWPNNETTAYVSYTQNWFDPWTNKTMTQISETEFSTRVYNNKFQLQNIWYYVTAVDAENNIYKPTLDQSKNTTVSDKVPPIIDFTIENSTLNDGEIKVVAYAIDYFTSSFFVNNTFYINMSSSSTYIETTMDYDPISRTWFKTHSFPFGDLVNISIGVHDDAGNFGKSNTNITIDDLAPPNIKRHGSIVYQNGNITIWAEVIEGPFGSGLAEDNSSVTIEIVYTSSKTATMKWNGSGNFYTYSDSGFGPTDVPIYQIKTIDKNFNENITYPILIRISDLTFPVCDTFDWLETERNHYSSRFTFWANASDPFGSISGVNLSISYYNSTNSWTKVYEMVYYGSRYEYSLQMIRNVLFNYTILISDGTNVIEKQNSSLITLDFQPAEILDYNIEIQKENIGEILLWCVTYDPLDDHNVTLTVFDDTSESWILNETLMPSNGSHYTYHVSIAYLHDYSYTIKVIDSGVITGYYNSSLRSNSSLMSDEWRPIFENPPQFYEYNGTVNVWVNVSDWGSGVTEVRLYYEFTPSNGGEGGQNNYITMEYNGSLYIAELSFNETGSLKWFIEAYDNGGASSTEIVESNTEVDIPNPIIFLGFTLEQIILIIILTILVLFAILFGGITIQRKRSVTYQRIQQIKNKLAIIPNVYTILVSTEVGVPIFAITNILYQKDGTLDDELSGLSVGIDSFLQSFQSDFMEQVQQQSSEYSTEMGEDETIRISVIEQHKIQIMILASQTYRIFVFLKEQPSKFVREAFYKAIKEIEKDIFIPNLGIVDETVFSPQVEAILRKYFPITLLMPFIIDIARLTKFDEELKRGIPTPISRAGINALKRLVVATSKMKIKTSQAEIKSFDDAMNKGILKDFKKILYNDAESIMSKLLEIPNNKIYEALWTGSSPEVNIIIPYEDRNLL